MGLLAIERKDFAVALELLRECVAFGRSDNDPPALARYLESLATAERGSGDADAAWRESLGIFHGLAGLDARPGKRPGRADRR